MRCSTGLLDEVFVLHFLPIDFQQQPIHWEFSQRRELGLFLHWKERAFETFSKNTVGRILFISWGVVRWKAGSSRMHKETFHLLVGWTSQPADVEGQPNCVTKATTLFSRDLWKPVFLLVYVPVQICGESLTRLRLIGDLFNRSSFPNSRASSLDRIWFPLLLNSERLSLLRTLF